MIASTGSSEVRMISVHDIISGEMVITLSENKGLIFTLDSK